jgi:DNA-binding NarL/FixJ family response regulator
VIRVIIADDHHLIRSGFKQYIARIDDMEVVAEAETGEQLMQILVRTSCDVVLLDISLPDKHGIDVLKELKSYFPSIVVLILSMHPEERYAKRALENGAAGYITKGSSPDELQRAIRKVVSGGSYISEALAEELAAEVGEKHAELPHHRLSDREFQILLLLGAGEPVKQIAGSLNLSVSTVHTYKQRIMEKMNFHSSRDLIQYVYTHGLADAQ